MEPHVICDSGEQHACVRRPETRKYVCALRCCGTVGKDCAAHVYEHCNDVKCSTAALNFNKHVTAGVECFQEQCCTLQPEGSQGLSPSIAA